MESADGDPESSIFLPVDIIISQIGAGAISLGAVVLIVLLLFSAFLSGSEVAFFSIKGEDLARIREDNTKRDQAVLKLLAKPRTLLATILISNNVVNIAIVILSTFLTSGLLNFEWQWLEFLVQVVLVTFLLVLFGEVIPKLYSNHFNIRMARVMANPMLALVRFLRPFSALLVSSSRFLEKRLNRHNQELTVEELNQAIELTSDDETSLDEKKILKGVVNFGNTLVKEIMCSRHDIVAYPKEMGFDQLLKEINDNRYSRLPIYEENLDQVVGILYIKDLLKHLGKGADYNWTTLIRKPFFVPEMMKIDDLLKEFQARKVHMAIVVDEYGGTIGLVTLEDVLEEIVGEITDEFDETEIFYSRLDDNTVVFFGKTSLSDVRKVLGLEPDFFEEYKADVGSIGGLVTELAEQIPDEGQVLEYNGLTCIVEATDDKKVERVKVILQKTETDSE